MRQMKGESREAVPALSFIDTGKQGEDDGVNKGSWLDERSMH